MENNERLNKNKIKRKQRILIASSLILLSLVTGGCVSIKITDSISTNSSNSSNSELDKLVNILKENWYSDIYYGKDIDRDVLINQFVGALSTSDQRQLDPYTYLIKNETTPVGIPSGKLGITITSYYDYPIIINVDPNGAAYNNLEIGDIVIALGNDENCYYIKDKDIGFNNIFTSALGPVESNLYVKVARFDQLNNLVYKEYNITLKEGNPQRYSNKVDCDIEDTLMVSLSEFVDGNNGTAKQLEEILLENDKRNIIIDLKDNPGGDLSSVVDVCDLFLPKDTLVTKLLYKNGNKVEHKTKKDVCYDFDKIVILQNGNSASASEILISTLSYYFKDKCVLVGTKSYGKGIAQRKVGVLDNKYTLQYTCAKWLRPDDSWLGMTIDSNTSKIGFYPDDENLLPKDELLKKLEMYNSYINYDENEDYLSYKLDKVSNQNKYFFDIYNQIYNDSVRIDGYFDNTLSNAISNLQHEYGLSETGIMDEDTFVCFVSYFYNYKKAYNDSYIEKAKEIILG